MAVCDSIEQWSVIEECPDYAISNMGRVMRVRPGKTSGKVGRELSQRFDKTGHLLVTLMKGKTPVTRQVHRLVALSFVHGRTNSNDLACHIDGNASNNNSNNLYWGNAQSNMDDAERHGTRSKGKKHSEAVRKSCKRGDDHYLRKDPTKIKRGESASFVRLTEKKVREIRSLYSDGVCKAEIARTYGVAYMTITKVVRRLTWAHIV